jgi:hypothetical protein
MVNHLAIVYGSATESSDWDFVIVVKDYHDDPFINATEKISAIIWNPETFQIGLNEHYIYLLICVMAPPQFVWKQQINFTWSLCLPKLRSTVSFETARTWVKVIQLQTKFSREGTQEVCQ